MIYAKKSVDDNTSEEMKPFYIEPDFSSGALRFAFT